MKIDEAIQTLISAEWSVQDWDYDDFASALDLAIQALREKQKREKNKSPKTRFQAFIENPDELDAFDPHICGIWFDAAGNPHESFKKSIESTLKWLNQPEVIP